MGSYKYSGEQFPYLRSRAELFRDCQRYAVKSWCNGDINIWKKHQGCIYLGADAFIRGLATFGCSFPLVINATVKFGCEREYVDGMGAASLENVGGPVVLRDFIHGKPIMIAQYNQSVIRISPSSAVVDAQNMPYQTAVATVRQEVMASLGAQ